MDPSYLVTSYLYYKGHWRGIYFAKIGAKITEIFQPLDLGPFLKILKMAGRHMTSVDTEKPLSIIVDLLFKHLRREKKLLLSGLKENHFYTIE